MKKVLCMCVCALVALSISVPAFALPIFKNEFLEKYGKPDTPLGKTIKEVIDKSPVEDGKHTLEGGCFLCHKAESKKKRNEYGEELSKYLKKDDFKKDKVEADPAKAKKAIEEAFKKAEADKNSKGEEFGKLIEEGKLPGGPADQ